MSKDMNRLTIIGRLGADPELRYTGSGDPVANVRIATTEKWKDGEHTEWHAVVFWGRLGEVINQYCAKGSRVLVEGNVRTRKYQHSDGSDRYVTEVRARDLILLDSKPSNGAARPAQAAQGSPLPDDGFDQIPFAPVDWRAS